MFHNILNNLKKLHNNSNQSQKSNILSVISYDNIKIKLRKLGYKFSNTQFNTSKKKRSSDSFNLKVYKRSVPLSKQKLSEGHKEEIIQFLNDNSRYASAKNENIKYLESSKKEIYLNYIIYSKYKKITYNTFLIYCPKYFKVGKRRTDVCGICELGKNLNKINVVNLSNEEKVEFDRNTYIVQKHKLVYQNQKQNFETIKDKLEERSCILILDFKENFKLSYGGN